MINNKNAETKFMLSKPSNHLNMEHYWGSAYCGEVDLDSEVNRLASVNLWQYTTVPSQCERLHWT